jgi:hypothetical protein
MQRESLEAIVKGIPRRYFQAVGATDAYAYVWFHGKTPIYVGKGTGNRYLMFIASQAYGSQERHTYIAEYGSEFQCYFAIRNVNKIVALECERLLVAAYGRRRLGTGSLFNETCGDSPAHGDFAGPDQFASARIAVPAPIPSNLRKLSTGKLNAAWKAQPSFPLDATISVLVADNPKSRRPATRFAKYVSGRTVAEYIDTMKSTGWSAHKTQQDLRWDYVHGWIDVL